LIRSSVFSISLSDLNNKDESTGSFIHFGGYDENLTQNSSYKFVWLYIRSAKTMWWEIEFDKAKYGSSEIDISVKYVTLDTGSSIIYVNS